MTHSREWVFRLGPLTLSLMEKSISSCCVISVPALLPSPGPCHFMLRKGEGAEGPQTSRARYSFGSKLAR